LCFQIRMSTNIVEATRRILADRVSGSTSLAKRLLKALVETKPTPEEALVALQTISSSAKSMVILRNVSSTCYKLIERGAPPSEAAEKILEELDRSVEECVGEGVIRLGGYKRFLTLSNSDQLLKLFTALSPAMVYVLESRPGGEGAILAKTIKKHGKPATMAPDLSAHILCGRVDCVVVGTDAVYERGFVNKLGTGLLTHLCAAYSKPIYAITTKWKVAEASRSGDRAGLRSGYNSVFEWVDSSELSSYISELGTLEPRGAYKRLLKELKAKT
jgi:translation initiation factor 2B subunit (eIF-2B alpha/beta/delta family)